MDTTSHTVDKRREESEKKTDDEVNISANGGVGTFEEINMNSNSMLQPEAPDRKSADLPMTTSPCDETQNTAHFMTIGR